MKVINLWGGPCCGKSTAAAGLFYEMKKLQLQVELVTEYAKDVTWEQRYNLLDDKIYIFAKQQRRITRLDNSGIEWVITDSPIPLGLVYMKPNGLSENFPKLVMEVFNKFENYNFFLQRHFDYNPVGRNQRDQGEAEVYDRKIMTLLDACKIPVDTIKGGEPAVEHIIQRLVSPTINK
jgi:AAA domain